MVPLLRKNRTGYLCRKSNSRRRAANSAGTKVASTTASRSRGNCERTRLLVAAEFGTRAFPSDAHWQLVATLKANAILMVGL